MRLSAASVAAAIAVLFTSPSLAAPKASTKVAAARVRYVGGGAVYLDRGKADGVAGGARIDFKTRGKVAGSCVVDDVSDHAARCAFADPKRMLGKVGERVLYDPADDAPVAPDVDVDVAAPVVVDAAAAAAALDAAALPKVAFAKSKRRTGSAIASRLEAGIRTRAYGLVGGGDSVFVRPSVDLAGRAGLGFVPGLYGSAALRVQGDILAPGNERFRNSVPAELYVWDAQIGLAPGRTPLTGALGRFRPQKAPGMSTIDGVALGYSGFGGALELGAYGGLVPDLITTAPSFDRIVAGAYFGLDAAPVDGLLLLPRARVGFLSSSDFQRTRAEVEAQVQALYKSDVAIGGSARVALPGDTAIPVLDAARLDVDATPLKDLHLRLGLRTTGSYDGDLDAGVIADDTLVAPVRAAHHGDLSVQWGLSDSVVVGGLMSVAVDGEAGLDAARALVGPEVALPQLFGSVGGLSFGAFEEPGLLWGRSGYLQAQLRPWSTLSWTTRLSYFEHHAPGQKVDDGALREAMLMSFVDAPVLPWLSLRGRAHGLFDIIEVDGFGATPLGVVVDVGANVVF